MSNDWFPIAMIAVGLFLVALGMVW